jgi:histidyl-tRNA synthetase
MDEKKVLFEVLTIIGYQDNKIDFVNKFFSYIYIEAIAQITSKLSEQTREKIGEELKNASDEESQKAIILRYLSKEEFDQKLTEITTAQFSDYLQAVSPTLSKEEQEKLTTYLSSLPKPEAH